MSSSGSEVITFLKDALSRLRAGVKSPSKLLKECKIFSRKLLSAFLYLLREYHLSKPSGVLAKRHKLIIAFRPQVMKSFSRGSETSKRIM